MKTAIVLFATAVLASIGVNASDSSLKKNIINTLLRDDLMAYVDGGESRYTELWSEIAVPWVSDYQAYQAYAMNPIGADRHVSGKVVFVRGMFVGAETGIDNDYIVEMRGLSVRVDKSDSSFLADKKRGETIEMACQFDGKFIGKIRGSCNSLDHAISLILSGAYQGIASGHASKQGHEISSAAERMAKNDDVRNGCSDSDGEICMQSIRRSIENTK